MVINITPLVQIGLFWCAVDRRKYFHNTPSNVVLWYERTFHVFYEDMFWVSARFSTFIDFCMRSQEQTRILIFVYCSKVYLMRMVNFLFLLLFNRTICVNVNTMCTSFLFVCLLRGMGKTVEGGIVCLKNTFISFSSSSLNKRLEIWKQMLWWCLCTLPAAAVDRGTLRYIVCRKPAKHVTVTVHVE